MPRAEIATTQARHTLLQLHAELGGKILQNKEEAERLAQDMRHVEAVLKMLDPSFDLRPIAIRRKKKNPYFKRGTIFRSVLAVLRTAQEPMTASDLTKRLLADKGAPMDDKEVFWNLFGGVQSSLRNNDGVTVWVTNEGKPAKWALIA